MKEKAVCTSLDRKGTGSPIKGQAKRVMESTLNQ